MAKISQKLRNSMLRDMTKLSLNLRRQYNISPVLTKDSFLHTFESPDFYKDGEVAAQIGEEGEIVRDRNCQDRLIIFNFADGTSFAPSITVPDREA
jgi:hypothetical protein